ncbi:DUF2299 family protein [Natrinema halophilum]|uniref:DUF2299 family protein n=1 Tax=Natrinema halophilum TaxID=1699371 RepID=UPI001F169086|nr:DUF2299 family protein [Natrinema halophilum]UHQ96279.1 DUF2299 family protein [Natrinema halophilum]
MTEHTDAESIRNWIDDDLVENVDQISDDAAEFNFTVKISNLLIHVIRREPNGPVLIGQQIEYGESIQASINQLSDTQRNKLIARIRETLTAVPVIYGFHDEHDNNVRFGDMHRIFLEHRIYPGEMSQHALMNGLIAVWKTMRYLDDITTLIDSVDE